MKTIRIYTDGGARGNPGPAGAGWLILDHGGDSLLEGKKFLGELTNNQAEYQALLLALQDLIRLQDPKQILLEIHMDSELVVRQLMGEYRVKNEGLKPLFREAQLTLAKFSQYRVTYIPREQNAAADALANAAMDDAL